MKTVPADFIPKWSAYFSALGSLQFATLAIGAGSLTLIIALRKWAPRLPGFLIAVVLASAIVALLHAPVETIGSRFPELPTGDRKSVVEGKSVSVRVDLGGRRNLQKKNKTN